MRLDWNGLFRHKTHEHTRLCLSSIACFFCDKRQKRCRQLCRCERVKPRQCERAPTRPERVKPRHRKSCHESDASAFQLAGSCAGAHAPAFSFKCSLTRPQRASLQLQVRRGPSGAATRGEGGLAGVLVEMGVGRIGGDRERSTSASALVRFATPRITRMFSSMLIRAPCLLTISSRKARPARRHFSVPTSGSRGGAPSPAAAAAAPETDAAAAAPSPAGGVGADAAAGGGGRGCW